VPADAMHGWTTLAALRAQVQKSWDKGDLLRELLQPTGAYPRRRTLKRPTAAQLRDSYSTARSWAAELHAHASEFALETVSAGRTTIGSNQVPAAAVFSSPDDEISFIGRKRQASRFLELARQLADRDPALGRWAGKRPLALVELGEDALAASTVALWLRDNPAPGIYVRQLSLHGVHTKFIEAHRRVIDEMVASLRADAGPAPAGPALAAPEAGIADRIQTGGVPRGSFADRHGFLSVPEWVRFRMLDSSIPLLGAARDVTVTAEAFASLDLPVGTVVVTENLVNFLALPELPDTMALFGGGYGFSSLRRAEWLRRREVIYWGDIDTHGFQILDQLRSAHSHVRSIMMDTETLLAHRRFWGSETKPTRAALSRLTPAEAATYEALVSARYGLAIRLEQEHIGWHWATEQLALSRLP
jgi:hypothetical protein